MHISTCLAVSTLHHLHALCGLLRVRTLLKTTSSPHPILVTTTRPALLPSGAAALAAEGELDTCHSDRVCSTGAWPTKACTPAAKKHSDRPTEVFIVQISQDSEAQRHNVCFAPASPPAPQIGAPHLATLANPDRGAGIHVRRMKDPRSKIRPPVNYSSAVAAIVPDVIVPGAIITELLIRSGHLCSILARARCAI